MICLKCGTNNEYRLCSNCQSIENLDQLYDEISSYNYEIGSNNIFIQNSSNEYADSISFRSVIWDLISYFDKDDVLYYYCKYFYSMLQWDNFEIYAIEYLIKNINITYETEVIMLYLLRYYIDKRVSFTKQNKYCELIRQTKNLLFQLYVITAKHYSQVGDFDIAEEICDYALLLSQDINYDRIYEFDNISNDKAYWINELLTILEENEKYRNKPYKPAKIINLQELKSIFESKNLVYPYDVTDASSPSQYINHLVGYDFLDFECLKNEKEKFENFCIDFINTQNEITYQVQVTMYHLLVFYITYKNSFTKQDKHCDFIRNTPNLHFQLYCIVATNYSRIGDFDIADDICQYALKLCNDESYTNFLWLDSNSCRENCQKEVEKIISLNKRYRDGKPYKPVDTETKKILKEIFTSKGLEYPYDITGANTLSKSNKIKEKDYPSLNENDDLIVRDYVVFWCNEYFNFKVSCIDEISAIRVKNGTIVEEFYSKIRPWDGKLKDEYKDYPIISKVIPDFVNFLKDDILLSMGALGKQQKLLKRALRYSPLIEENGVLIYNNNYRIDKHFIKLENSFIDILDYASEISEDFFDNNNNEYICKKLNIKFEKGQSALDIAKINISVYEKLIDMDS